MRSKRSKLLGVAFGLLAAGVLANGCGTLGSEFPAADAGFDDSSFGDAGAICSPPCGDGQKCSRGGGCIPLANCSVDADCTAGMVCDQVTDVCIPGGKCGADDATGTPIAPNVLVVQDRSCSMTGSAGAATKWATAVAAVNTFTTTQKGKIRFGLTLFPDITGASCAQDAIAIPVAPGTETQIQTLLTNALQKADPYFPDGPCVTNIDTAMQQAATEPAFTDATRGNFVVLITDGQQEACNAAGGDTGTTQIIADLLQKKIPTFVIGFGAGVDPKQLNIFATAGGTALPDPLTKFYKAEDQPSLDAALSAIGKKTLGCSYTLSKTPPDAQKIFVFFDNTNQVQRDPAHGAGWDYDSASNTVTFYGATCDDLKLAKVTDVDIVFGCAEPTPK